MARLPSLVVIFMLLLLMTKFSSSRTLGNPSPNNNHGHQRITFLMRDMLNGCTHYSEKPATTKVTGQIPFPKSQGFLPSNGGIPIPQSTPTIPLTASSTQTLDLSSIGFFFPTRATLQELDYGSVTSIDEDLLEGDGDEIQKLGKAQGVCVASSEDGSSHMVAVTASFLKGEYQDGLRLFGVHKSDVFESHVAVIGGTGKYYGANGYAAVKVVDKVGSSTKEGKVTSSKFLLFDVYLRIGDSSRKLKSKVVEVGFNLLQWWFRESAKPPKVVDIRAAVYFLARGETKTCKE
ncbi:Dirigent protein 18, partial [Mucuna pruriens]